jgi:hypothetical protein
MTSVDDVGAALIRVLAQRAISNSPGLALGNERQNLSQPGPEWAVQAERPRQGR